MLLSALGKFWSWLAAPAPEYLPTISYGLEDIADLRARDLKKLLRKMGVMDREIAPVLDKGELQNWALRLMQEERAQAAMAVWHQRATKATVMVALLTILFLAKAPLGSLLEGFAAHIMGQFNGLMRQWEMVRVAVKQQEKVAAVLLAAAIIIDVLQQWMQASTLMTWVIPAESAARILLFPYFFSLPISTDMLPKGNMLRKIGGGENGGSYGMNMAPMVCVAVAGWLKRELQERGAAPIVNYVLEKERRKEARRQTRLHKEQEEQEQHAEAPAFEDMTGDYPPSSKAVPMTEVANVADPIAHAAKWEEEEAEQAAFAAAVAAEMQHMAAMQEGHRRAMHSAQAAANAQQAGIKVAGQSTMNNSRGAYQVRDDDLSFLTQDGSSASRIGDGAIADADVDAQEPFVWASTNNEYGEDGNDDSDASTEKERSTTSSPIFN